MTDYMVDRLLFADFFPKSIKQPESIKLLFGRVHRFEEVGGAGVVDDVRREPRRAALVGGAIDEVARMAAAQVAAVAGLV